MSLYSTVLALFLFTLSNAHAWTEKVNSIVDPTTFAPNDLTLENYEIKTDLHYEWIANSLEWTRVDHELPVARAQVKLFLIEPGVVSYRGQLFSSHEKEVIVPIVLLEEPGNEIKVINSGTKLPIRFKSTNAFVKRATLDPSCSSFAVSLDEVKLDASWAVVHCHAVHTQEEAGHDLRVELKILWEQADIVPTEINHRRVDLADPVVIPLSIDSTSGSMLISRGSQSFVLKTNLPNRFNALAFGAGLGPYSTSEIIRPFVTLYGSYYVNESLKFVSFSALPLGSPLRIDQGFYAVVEQIKGLDERLSVNLLLGAHFINFEKDGFSYTDFSAPQGVEFQFRDFLKPRRSASLGGFFYPEINGTSYINSWIRYGWPGAFLEFNYIRWKEPTSTTPFTAASYGISYGFPLFRAL